MKTIDLNSEPIFKSITFNHISGISDEVPGHLVLDLFRNPSETIEPQKAKLYLVPTSHGDEYDPDFSPMPTSASDLPELCNWVLKYAVSALEIWAGKRPVAQLARWTHRAIYSKLQSDSGKLKEIGRVRKLHVAEPLDGIAEAVLTVRFGDRLRSLVMRFEGVDQKWLCTELFLI
jgi:Family of unknown function (DUF6459)